MARGGGIVDRRLHMHEQRARQKRFEQLRRGERDGREHSELAEQPPAFARRRHKHGRGAEREAHADDEPRFEIAEAEPCGHRVGEVHDGQVFVALAVHRVHTEPVDSCRDRQEHHAEHHAQHDARCARAQGERVGLGERGVDLRRQLVFRGRRGGGRTGRMRLTAFLERVPLRGGGGGIAGGNTIAGGTAAGGVRGAVDARLVFWGGFVLCHGYDCTSTSEPWHRRQCVRELEEGMEKPPRTHQRPLTLAAFLPWGDWVT